MNRDATKLIVAGAMAIVLAVAVSACERAAPEGPSVPPPEVEEVAMLELSLKTAISVEDMEVVGAERREWPDACLGLAEPDEQCAEMITPGWALTIEAEGQTYVVRTDDVGLEVRIE